MDEKLKYANTLNTGHFKSLEAKNSNTSNTCFPMLSYNVPLVKIAPSTHAHFFLMAPLFMNTGEGLIESFVTASENLNSWSNAISINITISMNASIKIKEVMVFLIA